MGRLQEAWDSASGPTLGAVGAYLLTAFLQPPLVDWIKYHGGTGPSSPPMLLPTLCNCLGMALVSCLGFVPLGAPAGRRVSGSSLLSSDRRLLRPVLMCTGIDLLSNALVMLGLLVVGGGVQEWLLSL